jgi:hypothetical protein
VDNECAGGITTANMKNKIADLLYDAVNNGKISFQEYLAIIGAMHYANKQAEDFTVCYGTDSMEVVKAYCDKTQSLRIVAHT